MPKPAEETFDSESIHLRLNEANVDHVATRAVTKPQEVAIKVKRGTVRGRGPNQAGYLHAIATHDINFGIGPAGTGKTFLAVASAVEALNESRVQRLILVRPAVEAGEKLGFLPGDLSQKVDPYLRPLYDALYEMLGRGEGDQAAGEERHRDRAAGLHARTHAQRRLRDPGRSAEHHHRTDEDVPDPHRLRQHRRGHRRPDPGRPAQAREIGTEGRAGSAARRGRHQLHLLHRARRGAASAGGARSCGLTMRGRQDAEPGG